MPSQGTIGDRVRGLRLSRRMSQAQLAGPDLSDSYVSLIESGKRTPTPVVARLLAERLGCTTEFLLHGIEPRQRIDTELGLRHAELELYHGDPAVAAERFGEIVKAAGEDNAMLAAHARLGGARALEAQGRVGRAVEAFERLRREAAAHPERLADLPLTVALSRCYQRAGDRLRARDLGRARARPGRPAVGVTQGEIAVDLAAALVWSAATRGHRRLRPAGAVGRRPGTCATAPRRSTHCGRRAATAAEGEDSALAVHLADDAIAAGRPARIALRCARIAMHWARLTARSLRRGSDAEPASSRARGGRFAAVPGQRQRARARVSSCCASVRSGAETRNPRPNSPGRALDLLDGRYRAPPRRRRNLVLAEVAWHCPATRPSHLGRAREAAGTVTGGSARPGGRPGCWRELGDLYGQVGACDQQTGAYRRALEAAGVRVNMAGLTVEPPLCPADLRGLQTCSCGSGIIRVYQSLHHRMIGSPEEADCESAYGAAGFARGPGDRPAQGADHLQLLADERQDSDRDGARRAPRGRPQHRP